MPVDREVVDYVAGLAKLRLEPEERRRMGEQLGRILEYVEQLRQVEISGVAPTKHVIEVENVSRPDEPRPSLPRQRALANAPEADGGHFVVPKVLPD